MTLPSDLEAFIDARVASGRFATAADAVREGLRLLEEREPQRDTVLAELRDEIEVASDVDVLVEFQPGHVPGLSFVSIEREFSELLHGRS